MTEKEFELYLTKLEDCDQEYFNKLSVLEEVAFFTELQSYLRADAGLREDFADGLLAFFEQYGNFGNSVNHDMAEWLVYQDNDYYEYGDSPLEASVDLSEALIQLRSYIASLPYDIITKKEWMAKKKREAFYKLLLYVIFSMLNSKVDTEVKSILGRADVVIKTKTDIFVLELKVDDSVENALAQIDSKGYAIPYEVDGRKVTKCGVCIASEYRNIIQWRITDAEGNVIEDKDFFSKQQNTNFQNLHYRII